MKPFNRSIKVDGELKTIYTSAGPTTVRVIEYDKDRRIRRCEGTSTPSALSGFSVGGIFVKTDAGGGTRAIYQNIGTVTSCNFDLMDSAAAGSTTFVGLTDTPANFTAAGDKILKVNTGATAVEFVTPSGDATMNASGAFTIAAGAIDNAKVDASAAIDFSKLASLTSANILVGDGSNVPTAVAMSGDATIDNAGAVTIAADAIDNAKVDASAGIVFSKLESLTSGELIVGSAGNVPTAVAMSGDGTLSAAGALAVSDLTIASEAQGDILIRGAAGWIRLAPDSGKFLRSSGAGSNPTWETPTVAAATQLANNFELEGGTHDPATTITTQTVGAATLTIPDFANVNQEWVFSAVAQILTNKTLTSPVLNTGVSGTAVLDEDDMASDSNTQLATQQSIKAYIDSGTVTMSNKTLTAPVLNNAVLTAPQINDTSADHQYIFGVSELAADRTVTLPLLGGNDTFVFEAHAQNLTNKVLTSPILTTPQINDTSADHQYIFGVSELAANRTITLPLLGGNDTFVFEAHTQTLTNKTLTAPAITNGVLTAPQINDTSADHQYIFGVSELAADRTVTLPLLGGNDTFVFEAHTQTLTNKSIDCANNTVTNVSGAELISVALPTAADASDAVGASTQIIVANISNQAAAVNIFNANAPFKFHICRAWSINTSADGGTWKLNNGAAGAGADITNAVTVAANDEDLDEPTDYNNAAQTINANGSLSIVPDGAGLLDCMIYIEVIKLS